MAKKRKMSTASSRFHESKRDKDKRRGRDSISKDSMSLTDQSIAIPNVKFPPLQSTTIES